jgi:hypothetical protein
MGKYNEEIQHRNYRLRWWASVEIGITGLGGGLLLK